MEKKIGPSTYNFCGKYPVLLKLRESSDLGGKFVPKWALELANSHPDRSLALFSFVR